MFLFQKKKENRPPEENKPKINVGAEAAETIKKLRGDIEQLEKRRKFMDVQVMELEETVRDKVRKKDKQGAKMALLRKNAHVKQAGLIDNQIITLESQCMQLENATTNMTAVNAMEAGLQAQKRIQAEMNADKVEQLFDDLAEQNDLQNEVADLFQQNAEQIGGDMDLDDELEQLQAQLLEEELLKAAAPAGGAVGPPATNPAAASSTIPAASAPAAQSEMTGGGAAESGLNADEEAQLRELQAQLQFA